MIVFTPTEQMFAVTHDAMRSFTIEKDNKPLFTTTSQHLATEVTRLLEGAYVTMQSVSDVKSNYEVDEGNHLDIQWFSIPEVITEQLTKGKGVWSMVPQHRASGAPDLMAIPRGGSNHARYVAALTLTLDSVRGNHVVFSEVERALEYINSAAQPKRFTTPSSAPCVASIIRASLHIQDAQDSRGRLALWSLLSQSALPALDENLVYRESPIRFLLETLYRANQELLCEDIRPENLRLETQRISNLLDEVASRHTLK